MQGPYNYYPLPQVGTLNYLKWVGGGTEQEAKGKHSEGGGGSKGGVKGEGQGCLGPWW